jgi:hypothetical protein
VSFVGIGQTRAGNFASEAHAIELALHRSQTSFDVAQTLAIGQLRECQTKKLIKAGKSPPFIISSIALNTLAKLVGWDVIHQLGEDGTADIHVPLLVRAWMPAKKGWSAVKSFEKVEIEKLSTSPYLIRPMRVTRQARSYSRTLVGGFVYIYVLYSNMESLYGYQADLRPFMRGSGSQDTFEPTLNQVGRVIG